MDSFDLLPSLADGELAESSAPELVAAILRSRASGTLTIEAPESGEVRQFFRAGQMCGSAYFTGFRTLAQVMLEQEWGQAIAIDETLAEAQAQGRRHGELLVEKGLLSAEQLGQVLAAQHRHNLMALMRLDRGHYEMRGWEPPPAWTRELNVDPLGPLFDTLEEPRLLHRRALVLDWIGGQAVRLTPDWPEMAQRAQLDAADLRAIAQLAVPRGRSEFLAVSRLATPRADALLAGLVLIGAAEPVAAAAAGARSQSGPAPSLYGSSLPPPPLSSPSRPISQPPRPISQPPRPISQPPRPTSQPQAPLTSPSRPISQPPHASPQAPRPFSQPPRRSEPSLPAARIPTPPQPAPPVSPPPPSRQSMPAARSGPRPGEAPRAAPPPVEEELDLVGPMARTAMSMSEPMSLREAIAEEEPLELDESALPEAQLASNPGVEKGAVEIEEEPEDEEGPLELDLDLGPRSRPTPHSRATQANAPRSEPVRDSNPFAMPGLLTPPAEAPAQTPADPSGGELRKKLRARGLRNVAGAARETPAEEPAPESVVEAPPTPPPSADAAVSRDAQRFIDEVRARVRMLSAQNPWQRLGVSRKATNEQIHTAYLEAVKRYHPDRASALGAASVQEELRTLFAAIKEAHERIGTAAARDKYTQISTSNPGGASPRQEEATLALKMGDVLLKKRDFAGAMIKLRRAAELDPNGDTLAALAWGLLCDPAATPATRSEAEMLIDRSLRVGGATARTHYVAGVSWRQRDQAAAGEAFKKALELDPNHRAASQELRLLELRQQRKK